MAQGLTRNPKLNNATDSVTAHQGGTWTEANSASIKTASETLAGAVTAAKVQVDVISMPTTTVTATNLDIRDLTSATDSIAAVQSGTWTEANSAAIKTAVEIIDNFISGSRGLVTEDNSAAIKTAVELIDDAIYTDGTGTPSKAIGVAGTDGTNPQIIKTDASGELQVDVLSMPTTTVTATDLDVRDLTSVSDSVSAVQSGTWNITNVSGTVSLPTGAATAANQSTANTSLSTIAGAVKAEDSASANLDTGVPTLAVRKATPADTSGTDGDYEMLQMSAGRLWVDASGKTLTVDGSGVTQPVSGTVTVQDGGGSITVDGTVAATQSGTWTLGANSGVDIGDVTINNASGASAVNIQDGGNSITVDGTVSVSGVATAANQSTMITSLSNIDTDTSNIQTAVQLIDDAIVADDAAFTPATTKVMMAGFEFDDTAPDSVNEGDAGAARISANRNQYIQIRDGAGNERGANVNASGQLSVSVDNTVTVASHAVTNAGTFAVQAAQSGTWTLGANSGTDIGDVTINNAAGASAVNIQDGGNSLTVDGTVAISGTVAVTDNSGSLTVDNPPLTSGGYSIYTNIDLDPTGVNPKASAGQVYGYYVSNAGSVTVYIKWYNKSSAPTTADTPVMTFPLYAGQTANMSFPHGIAFGAGIGLRATTGVATADTGDPGVNVVIVNVMYA